MEGTASKSCVLWHSVLSLVKINNALTSLINEINGNNLKPKVDEEVKQPSVPVPSLKGLLDSVATDAIADAREMALKQIEELRVLLI